MGRALYLDASALLRATLEAGTTPEIEDRITNAEKVVTSRLSLVECARALIRTRVRLDTERSLDGVEQQIGVLFSHCELWELSAEVCDLACRVAPGRNLRALDSLHLATFLLARRQVEDLELLTADLRLQEAANSV